MNGCIELLRLLFEHYKKETMQMKNEGEVKNEVAHIQLVVFCPSKNRDRVCTIEVVRML